MELFKALSPVIQVFMLIVCGFVFAQWKRINLTSLTEIIVYLGTPSLVFSSLAGKPLFVGDIAVLFGGILINSRAFVATHRDARTGDDSNYADKSGLSPSRCGIAAMGPRARRSAVANFRRL